MRTCLFIVRVGTFQLLLRRQPFRQQSEFSLDGIIANVRDLLHHPLELPVVLLGIPLLVGGQMAQGVGVDLPFVVRKQQLVTRS